MSFTDSIQADHDAVANIIRAETGCGYAGADRAAAAVLAWVDRRTAAIEYAREVRQQASAMRGEQP